MTVVSLSESLLFSVTWEPRVRLAAVAKRQRPLCLCHCVNHTHSCPECPLRVDFPNEDQDYSKYGLTVGLSECAQSNFQNWGQQVCLWHPFKESSLKMSLIHKLPSEMTAVWIPSNVSWSVEAIILMRKERTRKRTLSHLSYLSLFPENSKSTLDGGGGFDKMVPKSFQDTFISLIHIDSRFLDLSFTTFGISRCNREAFIKYHLQSEICKHPNSNCSSVEFPNLHSDTGHVPSDVLSGTNKTLYCTKNFLASET